MITDCDECGWQACFKATDCAHALAAEQGIDPQDVVDQAVLCAVPRVLPQNELEQLAADMTARLRPKGQAEAPYG